MATANNAPRPSAARNTVKAQSSARPLSRTTRKKESEILEVSYAHRPFRRINFYLMGGCVLLIVIGFLLMLGPGSSVEEGFNPDIFSTRRIAVGPAITFLGFLLMAFAIIWQPRRGKKQQPHADTDE